MMHDRGSIIGSAILFLGLILLLLLARGDRGEKALPLEAKDRAIVNAEPAAPVVPPAVVQNRALGDEKALADEVAERRRELDRVTKELEQKQRQIQDREKEEKRPVAVVEKENDERDALKRELETLKKAVETAQADAKNAQESLATLKQEKMAPFAIAAQNGVARGLGRGALLDAQTRLDSRRFRDPSLAKSPSSQAAVAAAGASAAAAAGGFGAGPGSTVGGDFARGQAEFMRAMGQQNLLNSQAAINAQTATEMALQNRLLLTETFFENRRINRAARALEAGPRPTMDQVIRYARMGLPPRLDSQELDPLTGHISWPIVLKDEVFQDDTKYIEKCFRERAAAASLSFKDFRMTEDAFASLKDTLKSNVSEYPAQEYGQARTFVDSLHYEFKQPVN